MTDIYALIVGIEKYNGLPELLGPCSGAVNIANWLTDSGVTAGNIQVFSSRSEYILERIEELETKGVNISFDTSRSAIYEYYRTTLHVGRSANSKLLVYLSGHGLASRDGRRIFFCSDYTTQLDANCIDISGFLRTLRTEDYCCFLSQICIFDFCSASIDLPIPHIQDYARPPSRVKQFACFAAREGEYTLSSEGGGVFTEKVIEVLNNTNEWTDHKRLSAELRRHSPFVIDIESDHEVLMSGSPNNWLHSVYKLLSCSPVPNDVFRPHYLRTAIGLRKPDFFEASALYEMVEKLCSLRPPSNGMPDGLLEFLVRLLKEPALTKTVGEWLELHTASQRQDIIQAKAKVDAELDNKILLIEVGNDENPDVFQCSAYIRYADLTVAGLLPQYKNIEVKNWHDLQTVVQSLLSELRLGGENSPPQYDCSEIHFLVDPPLFDWPFHLIPVRPADMTTIGKKFVVLLRYRSRLRSSERDLRRWWREHALALRTTPHDVLKWQRIESDSLPDGSGPYFATFVLPAPPQHSRGSVWTEQKAILNNLLEVGVPYILWLHNKPIAADWQKNVEDYLTMLMRKIETLDDVPTEIHRKRRMGYPNATLSTILWDDPEFIPFTPTYGVSNK